MEKILDTKIFWGFLNIKETRLKLDRPLEIIGTELSKKGCDFQLMQTSGCDYVVRLIDNPESRKYHRKIDTKEFTSLYNLSISVANKNNIGYMVPCSILLKYLMLKEIPLRTILRIINRRAKNEADYYFLGLLYYYLGTNKIRSGYYTDSSGLIRIETTISGQKEFTLAKKCFTYAIQNDIDNPELFYLFSSCDAAIGNLKEAMDIWIQGNTLFHIPKNQGAIYTSNFIIGSTLTVKLKLTELINKGRYEEGKKLSESLTKLQGQNMFSNILMNNIYIQSAEYYKIIELWAKHRKVYPNGEWAIHFLGRTYLRMYKFYFASLYFKKEIQLLSKFKRKKIKHKYDGIVKLFYNYSLGMHSWKIGLLENAKEYFVSCAKIIKSHRLRNFKSMVMLPKIIEFIILVNKLMISKNIDYFCHTLPQALKMEISILTKSNYFPKEFYTKVFKTPDFEYVISISNYMKEYDKKPKLLFPNILMSYFSFLYLLYLKLDRESLINDTLIYINKHLIKLIGRGITSDSEFFFIALKGIEYYKGFYEKIGFYNEAHIFEKLLRFLAKLENKYLNEINEKEWKELRNIFLDTPKPLLQESTQKCINQFIMNINIGRLLIDFGSEEQTQKTDSEVKETEEEKKEAIEKSRNYRGKKTGRKVISKLLKKKSVKRLKPFNEEKYKDIDKL